MLQYAWTVANCAEYPFALLLFMYECDVEIEGGSSDVGSVTFA